MDKKNSALSQIVRYTAPYKGRYILSVILAVIGELLGMLPYFAVARIITAMLSQNGEGVPFYLLCCTAGAAGYIGKGIFSALSTVISHNATFLTMKELRQKLVAKLTRMPMGTLLNTPSGYYKDVIVDRVESIEIPLAHLLPEMTSSILAPLFILLFLFTVDWRMALLSLITLPLGMLIMRSTMGDYGEKYAGSVIAGNKMTNAIVEYMGGIEVIKAFSQSARSYEKYSGAVKENASYFYNWMKGAQWPMSCYTAIAPAVLLPVLPLGFLFYADGSLTAFHFVTVIILALGIIGPLITASNYVDSLARVGTVIGQIQEILDSPELERPDRSKRVNGSDIKFQDVSFTYSEDSKNAALQNCTINIPAGRVTALVGPSGSGKSTIAKLAAGFWDIDDGQITLGDKNVKDLPLQQHASQIAYVSQDNYLFDDTIRENIRMGQPNATDAEVERAALEAGCDTFIRNLESGYDTVVGSAGGHLSGGERQRVAIARAMLKNAPIVILDEATAYIDPENEALIQTAVAKLIAGKTLLVIAHRLSTITDADQIVVMDSGKVSAVGTHETLLKRSPLYHEMWKAHIGAKDGDAA